MKCTPFGAGFVCTRGARRPRCSVPGCSDVAPFLCDFLLRFDLVGGKPGSDGSAFCHYCPPHDERASKEVVIP